MQAGDNHNALPLLQRARQQTPRHVDLLYALGECLTRLGRPREALEPFDTAIAIAPEARLHFARAMALEDLSELDGARAGFEQALALDPAQSEALSRLALLAVQRGDVGEARTLAERALAIDSKDAAARIALAGAALEQKEIATAEMAVSALVQDRTLGPVNRTFAFSLAGDILDMQDRTAEAFSAYAASKAIQRDAFLPSIEGVERVLARETRLAHYFRRIDQWPSAQAAAGWTAHTCLPGRLPALRHHLAGTGAGQPSARRRDGRASLPDRFRQGFFRRRCRFGPAGGTVRCRVAALARSLLEAGGGNRNGADQAGLPGQVAAQCRVPAPDRAAVSQRENPAGAARSARCGAVLFPPPLRHECRHVSNSPSWKTRRSITMP